MRLGHIAVRWFALGCTAVVFAIYASAPATACAAGDRYMTVAGAIKQHWQSVSHPLIGRVLRDGRPWPRSEIHLGTSCGDESELSETLRAIAGALSDHGAVLILGEVHDNTDDHWLQSQFAPFHGPDNTKTGWVFEQFRADQQPVFDKLAADPVSPTLEEFKRLTGWDKSGWQQYNYDPLLQAVIDAKLPLYAGDVAKADMMTVARQGPEALPHDERARLKLDVPLGEANDAASFTEIEESHCGLMPKEALKSMAFAQRYRDASLADATLTAAEKHGSAILITGNGHARTDRGVAWYIRQRAPDRKVVSVMLIEVEDGKTDPEAYVQRGPDGKPTADYIIFTPRVEHEEQCAKMRERMKK